MTSVHYSENVVREQAKTAAKKKSRKYLAIGAAVAVLGGSGAAWAAMTIFGEGTASATSYQAQNVTVSNEAFNKQIFPGVSADLTFKVTNPNPFPVTIQSVAVDTSRAITVNCEVPAEAAKLSGPAMNTTGSYSIPSASQVTVGANGGFATMTVPGAVHLDNSATKGCALTIPFKVTGASAGNQ